MADNNIGFGTAGHVLFANGGTTPATLGAPVFLANLFGIKDNSDTSKIARFVVSGITTATTRSFTLPNYDGTLATLAGTETFTNKTLTTPSISGAITFPDDVRQTFNPGTTNAGLNVGALAGDPSSPSNGDIWYDSTANELTARINGANVALGAGGGGGTTYSESTPIADSSSNELLKFAKTTSAVNEFTITNNATGSAPIFGATGGDTNIDIVALPKGSGKVRFATSSQGFIYESSGLMLGYGSTDVMRIDSNFHIRYVSSNHFGWTASTPTSGFLDTAFRRHSAGVIATTKGWDGTTYDNFTSLIGGGASVASASALPLPTGRVFHVTGTTNITSITATNFQSGVVITLIFDGVLTFTDGNNLKLAGNFVTTADDTITLVYDGTNFYEIARSTN